MSASIQKKRRKRVEEVRVRRSTSSGDAAGAGAVLDLRTIVAQREIERARREQEQQLKQLHTQLQHRHGSKQRGVHTRPSLFARMFHRKKVSPDISLSVPRPGISKASVVLTQPACPVGRRAEEISAAGTDYKQLPEEMLGSLEQVGFETEETVPPMISVWSQEQEEESGDTDVMPRRSFWERPLDQPDVDEVDPKTLPLFGFTKRSVLKPALVFACLSILVIVPANVSAMLQPNNDLAAVVTESAEEAFVRLQEAGNDMQQFDFDAAQKSFAEASEAFQRTQQEIQQINGVVLFAAQYIPGTGGRVQSGLSLLTAGEELAAAGEQLSEALQTMNDADIASLASNEDTGLTSLLVVMHSALGPTTDHVRVAVEHLNGVSVDDVPLQYREVVAKAQDTLPAVLKQLEEATQLSEALLGLLGHNESKRYMVLFQNNYEIRPTGGFVGSLAVVDVHNGVVTGLDIPSGGVYDIAGQLEEKVIAPSPLHLVNPHWNLQDANWFPHFPTTAEKVQWFYARSRGGTTVDGVITLVPRVVEQLLAITGPISLTDPYGVIITADNFYDEVQLRAEEKYEVTRESKKIISDLTPKLFNALFDAAYDPSSLLGILAVLQEAVDTKDILIAVNDPEIQYTLSDRDWSGEIKRTDRDYLAVIDANIGGGKTDGVIDEMVKHRAEIAADGSVVDTVTITRVHNGDLTHPLQQVKNVDYVRVYVPQGSTLLSAKGFTAPSPSLFLTPDPSYKEDTDLQAISGDVTVHTSMGVASNDEFEKTVFGGWVQTDAGSSSTVTLQYRLPFRITVDQLWNQLDHYSLLVQKQPGSWGTMLIHDLVVPSNLSVQRRYPETYQGSIQEVLDDDLFGGVILQRAD